MRFGILSDVHSNLEALTAVLEHCASQRVDRLLCLGDMVGYGADPSACLSLLDDRHAISVAGNHEWACIGKLDAQWFNDAARKAILWTRDQLSFGELDTLRRLPLTTIEEPATLVHSTLTRPERFEYLMDLAHAVDTAKVCRTTYCLIGHTHVPCVVAYDVQARRLGRVVTAPQELGEVRLEQGPSWRYIMNPGSVGQPRDGDPRASYAVLDADTGVYAIHRVSYDVQSAQQKIRAAKLPDFLADRLAVGR